MRSSARRRSAGRVGGGDGVVAGLDLDRAIAAGCADELPYRPAGGVLHAAADGQGGEHDGQVGLDRLAFVVVDRPGLKIVFGHAERFFALKQQSFSPAWSRNLASSVRLTRLVPPDSCTNRLRLTAVLPATAFSVLATCSSMPRRVRLARSTLYW